MNEINVEYLPLDALKPYERNARKHSDADINAILSSIKEFGFNDPIGVWSDENIVVEGHGRLIAAERAGMQTVPCIRLDHLTDEQRKAYALAHNRTAELSKWDVAVRDEELEDITSIDMKLFGFVNDVSGDEIREAKFTDTISVVVEFDNDEDAEELFNRLTEEGYECRLSTL